MDTREVPVLSAGDQPLVDRLAAGLGENAARVLAYLVLRAEHYPDEEPASEPIVQLGTELNRSRVKDALATLCERELATETTVRTTTSGRPPRAWYTTESRATATRNASDRHAQRLLERSRRWADSENTDGGESVAISEPRSTVSSDADSHVTVGLNWRPNGLQLPLFAALAGGEYDRRGVSVTLEEYRGSARAIESVVDGEADVAIAGAASIVRARADGEPVVPIVVWFQRPMVVFYTTREPFGEPLETVGQLRGRRVGMPIESETGLLGRLYLSQAGVLEETECVDLRGEESEPLQSGTVEVVTGTFSDPMRLEDGGATVDSIHVADQYPIYGPAIVAHAETLRRQPRLLETFLAGTVAGWALATEDPSTAARDVARQTDRPAAWIERVFERAADRFGTTDAVRKHGWGWQSPETWSRLEEALEQVDLLEVRS
ncbi:ABC transporter substrate-binding protein [Natronobeatus ordinarius]|uniref:ABC transporter substrate-binding protein n=1 Tax=Natronobeatus ordinarius TaxID=2963433 RepID=UPI0020CE6BE8|nr:ABC transporter substrate-binding protein [Natronobeatus ordinarius]